MKVMMKSSLLALVAATFAAGCTMAPDYQRPELPVPATLPSTVESAAPAAATESRPLTVLPWREFYRDPALQQVIALGLEQNRDLRVAMLRLEQSRALYQIEGAALLPEVNAAASGSMQRVPADLNGGNAGIRRQYSAGLGVSAYELDFFGRVRSLKEEALQEYLATAEAQRSVQIGLIAEIANRTLSLIANRESFELAKKTLEGRIKAFDLVSKRYDAGIVSALDRYQAQSAVESARVELARFRRLIAQDENGLQLLIGAPLPEGLLPVTLPEETLTLQEVPVGLSSEVLLNRPDILRAEHRLQGVTAHIGAARAAFFPRVTLTGSLGTSSAQLSGLFKGGSGSWSFLPQITLPIFDGGTNRSELKIAKAEREIALAEYDKAIQTAFREVADALAAKETLDEQLAAQASLTDAVAASLTLAEARYNRGIDSYLAVLDAERSLYTAEQGLIATRLARIANLVTLYKVLGGGEGEVVTE